MNPVDLFIVLPIAYFAYRGFRNGFIQEFFSIAGIILAVFVTFTYMGPLSSLAKPYIENPDTATIIAGIVIFIVTLAVIQVLAYWLETFFGFIRLTIINQLAGSIFGAVKSAIIVSATLLLLAAFDIPDKENRNASASYALVIYVAPATYNIIATAYPHTEDFIRTIETTIKENNPLRTLPIFEN